MNIKRCDKCGMTTNDETCGQSVCLEVPGFAKLETREAIDQVFSDYKTMSDKIRQYADPVLVRREEVLKGSTAAKFDSGKAPLSLIPKSALIGAAEVLEMGKQKYSAHNWKKGMEWSRLVDASMRHLLTWNEGESIDEESKKSHLAHAIVNLMFLYEYEAKGLGNDDRYKGENNGK